MIKWVHLFDLEDGMTERLILTEDMKNWGTKVIPKERWIDVNKSYICDGKRVIGLYIKLHNDVGDEVTYPVKGSIVVRENPIKLQYALWSLDGRADVVWGKGYNLVEVKSRL